MSGEDNLMGTSGKIQMNVCYVEGKNYFETAIPLEQVTEPVR